MKIAFIQLVCPTYKVDLFSLLSKSYCIDFFIGDKGGFNIAPTSSSIDFDFNKLKNLFFSFLGVQFVWQSGIPFFQLKKYDLVVLSPSVPYISNYVVILLCKLFRVKVGFYGMGINYQKINTKSSGFLERFRAFLYEKTDFVIVYTDEIKNALVNNFKLSERKIFVARNTLNVEKFLAKDVQRDIVCDKYDVVKSDVVVSYVGRISEEKKPWILLDVLKVLNLSFSVTLIYVGDGPGMSALQNLVNLMPDSLRKKIKLLGRKEEDETTDILKISSFSVMPGMTGLAVVHSMACGANYITVFSKMHSPEYSYIQNGINAWVVDDTSDAIAQKICEVQLDPSLLHSVSEAAKEYCAKYLSINAQISGFNQAFESLEID